MPAWVFFANFKQNTMNGAANGQVDFDNDPVKIALVTNVNIPDTAIGGDDFFDDLEATEVSGTGYTAGGETPGTPTINEAAGVVTYDAIDVSWAQNGAGFTDARHAILYHDTGTPATSALVATMNMAVDKGNTTGALTLEFAATGIFTLSG